MAIPSATLFVYRFRTGQKPADKCKVYGPVPLDTLLARYGDRPECEGRPTDDVAAAWEPVAHWAELRTPPPPTGRQLSRLENLGVAIPPNLNADSARDLIRDAEGRVPPTPKLREKAEKAGVAVAPDETGASLKAKMAEAERAEAIAGLRKEGIELPDDASWDDVWDKEDWLADRPEARKVARRLARAGVLVDEGIELDRLLEYEDMYRDLKEVLREAQSAGLSHTIDGLPAEELEALLEDLSISVDVYEYATVMLQGDAKRADIKGELPALFRAVRMGKVDDADAAREWLEKRLRQPAGCMLVLALPLLATIRWFT